MSSHNNDPVLVVDDLRVAFPNRDGGFTEAVRGVWLDGFEKLKQGTLDAAKLAAAVQAVESRESPATGALRGEALQRLFKQLEVPAT